MRKSTAIWQVIVLVVLLGGAAWLYGAYRSKAADYSSLQAESEDTQSRYSAAIDEIAAIQDSLNTIALPDSTVRFLSSSSEFERRLSQTNGDRALARISLLKAGIERTKTRIGDLEASLRRSGARVGGLEKLVANLRASVQDKETMVAQLTDRVKELETRVAQGEVQIAEQAATIEEKQHEIGTIYYAIGSKDQLEQAGLIESKGGFLGIGRTVRPTGMIDDREFVPLDTFQQDEIVIPSKKAEVVSAQPATSYELETVGDTTVLHITDPDAFRSVKHVLILTA